MKFISAYLLAATVVETGSYDEEYEVYDDPEFAEEMEEWGSEAVGEYIQLKPPNDGQGSFSGDQFCDDWYVAFERPIEYGKIFSDITGHYADACFKDVNDPDKWTGFTWTGDTLIPEYADQKVYAQCGKHINFWAMGWCALNGRLEPRVWGAYMGENGALRCVGNYPTLGYIDFNLSYTGNVQMLGNGATYVAISRGINEDTGAWYTDWAYEQYAVTTLRLVYNVDAYKDYLERSEQSQHYSTNLVGVHYILAECNIKKEKEPSGTTDWSDNDDYHGE